MTAEFSPSPPDQPYRMLGFAPTIRIEGLPRNMLEGIEINLDQLKSTEQIPPELYVLLPLNIFGTNYLLSEPSTSALPLPSIDIGYILATLACLAPWLGPVINAAISSINSRGKKLK